MSMSKVCNNELSREPHKDIFRKPGMECHPILAELHALEMSLVLGHKHIVDSPTLVRPWYTPFGTTSPSTKHLAHLFHDVLQLQ